MILLSSLYRKYYLQTWLTLLFWGSLPLSVNTCAIILLFSHFWMLLPCLPPSTAVAGTGPPREARSQLWAQEWPGVELTGSVLLSPTVFCQQVIASSPLFVAGMLILWVLAGFCGQKLSKRLMCVCHCLCGHKWEPSEPHLVTRLPFFKLLIFVYSLSLSLFFFSFFSSQYEEAL